MLESHKKVDQNWCSYFRCRGIHLVPWLKNIMTQHMSYLISVSVNVTILYYSALFSIVSCCTIPCYIVSTFMKTKFLHYLTLVRYCVGWLAHLIQFTLSMNICSVSRKYSIAQLAEWWTGLLEGASLNPARVNIFPVDISCVR